MNNTATREELKAILDEWIPKYIRQVVELRSGSRLSAERYNELMNLLITQGDDTIELAETVKQYMELLVADEEAAREEFTQSITQSLNETTAKVTNIAENAVVTAESAVSSVNQYKAVMDTNMEQFKNTVNSTVSQMNNDIVSFKASVTQSITDSDARVNSAVETANQLTADMEAYRTELTQLTEKTFTDMQTALSQQVSDNVATGIASLKDELLGDINTTISELEEQVMTIANTAEQAVNSAVQDIEAYKANMDARLDEALKEVEDSLSVAGEVIQDASEIYARIDEMNTLVNGFENRIKAVEEYVELGDADTLDGKHAADFASVNHEHEDLYAPKTHSHTASQVGLSNVPNVATNDQTPTYTVASSNAELTSGEKLSVAFSKIAKAIKSFIAHLADTTSHITSTERTTWNGKANASHGNHVPTTQTADNATFLRNDNTWQKVTPANIGAAASSHGTHVSFSTTAPVMDGTASAGSASTVARSDHKHPTDTSRAAATHTHTKSQITDFPTSLPASDVSAWAKASSKPSYTWSEITSKPTSFTPAAHNQGASTVTAGIFAGKVNANATASASLGVLQMRDIGITSKSDAPAVGSSAGSTTKGTILFIRKG